MPEPELVDVEELQSIKGVPFPADVSFRQVIVTGPPGTGKTTLMSSIGGWPEEGFLDLTQRNWWRARALTFRPRQIHMLFPVRGFRRALSVFEEAWLEPLEPPPLDVDRVQTPPRRLKYVFDFLLPPAEEVFEARSLRSDRRSHPIDVAISLDKIRAQLDTYRAVARLFHHAGVSVYVRDRLGGPPKRFRQPSAAGVVESQPRQSGLHSYIKRIISPRGYRVLDRFERVHLVGKRLMIPRRILPVEVTVGPQKLRVDPESPSGSGLESSLADSLRVFDPDGYFAGISPFARIATDEILRLPNEQPVTPGLPEDVPSRIEITNEGDWIIAVDLDSPSGTVIRALDGDESDRLARDRAARARRLRTLLRGVPPPMSPQRAADEYGAVLEQLDEGRFRERDWRGEPGGVVELPDSLTPIIVGDLHAEVDNLLLLLTEGRYLDELEAGTAALVILGDAVHPEVESELTEMGTSLLMMDVVVRLMSTFPGQVFYLRGNHDTFSPTMTKGGVSQGKAWEDEVRKARGDEGVKRLQAFYDRLPYVAVGKGFVACHAGPPQGAVSRSMLVDVRKHKWLAHQLAWSRVFTPRNAGGYTKRDVRALVKALDAPKKETVLIVSHNPKSGDTVQLDHGGIKRHHLVYSASRDRVSVFTRIGERMVPLTYPVRPVLDAVGGGSVP